MSQNIFAERRLPGGNNEDCDTKGLLDIPRCGFLSFLCFSLPVCLRCVRLRPVLVVLTARHLFSLARARCGVKAVQ